jgi:hypothetical protein|tara:strand:+ start:52 stop:426 length:375 start_codon:yes stop_codon:yes gene_type:complete
MPKKKTATVTAEVEILTIPEVIEEVTPKKHIVMVKINKNLPNIPVPVEFPVGEVRYWESTDDITYSYEAGYQIYMDNFVNRAIQIEQNKWVPRQSTRKWVEHLPNAILPDGYFTSDILTLDEVE